MSEDTDHWEQVQHWYRRREYPIQVCVGQTADAAAALHTLTHLLKSSRVLFEVHPVAQYSEIRSLVSKAEETLGDDAELLWVCLGCGAGADLDEVFSVKLKVYAETGRRPTTIVHLIDSVRPVSLENLSNAHRYPEWIRVWGFDAIVERANTYFNDLDKQAVRRNKASRKKRARGRDVADENEEDSSSELSSSDSDGDTPAHTWLADLQTLPEAKVNQYKAVFASGPSVAVSLYDLALLIRCPQESYLWNAAVGVTDLYMRRLIPERTYTLDILKLCSAINEWNALKRSNRLAEISNRNVPVRDAAGANSKGKASEEQMHLAASVEYRPFYLLRHWSLWSALWHQRDVAAWLSLYTDRGEETLRHLLAICGVSQQQANKPWASVPLDDRRSVLNNLQLRMMGEPTTDEYGRQTFEDPVGPFDKFDIRTVSRTVGYSAEVSAFDACVLFNAVIAAEPPGIAATTINDSDDNNQSAQNAPSQEVVTAVESSVRGHQRSQFWAAHAILVTSSHSELFAHGLEEAKYLTQSTFDSVSTLLQPGAVRSTRTLHYVAVTERNMQAIERFWSPPRLLSLAEHLLVALNNSVSKGAASSRSRPLLICAAVPAVCSAVFKHNSDPAKESTETKYVVAYAFPNVGSSSAYSSIAILQRVNASVADRTLHPDPTTIISDGTNGRWLSVSGSDSTTHFVEAVSLRSASGALPH